MSLEKVSNSLTKFMTVVYSIAFIFAITVYALGLVESLEWDWIIVGGVCTALLQVTNRMVK